MAWKGIGEKLNNWLARLFNKITKSNKMLEEWSSTPISEKWISTILAYKSIYYFHITKLLKNTQQEVATSPFGSKVFNLD